MNSMADVEPPGNYINKFPCWNGEVNVIIPREVARTVAHRVGIISARGKTVTGRTVADFAADHATITTRFLVPTDDRRESHTHRSRSYSVLLR